MRPQLAHEVCVLYLWAPPGMVGGTLDLRDPARPPWRTAPPGAERDAVDATVVPRANRMARFRGDAEHAVASHALSGGDAAVAAVAAGADGADEDGWAGVGDRVSLVLEQYKVPIGSVDFTTRFELVNPADYHRAY